MAKSWKKWQKVRKSGGKVEQSGGKCEKWRKVVNSGEKWGIVGTK